MKVSEILSEIFGGSHGFGGEGRGFFTQKYYQYFAGELARLNDVAIRDYLTTWLASLFASDNPAFKPALFRKAVEDARPYHTRQLEFQQRHFYYLAEHISRIADRHMREFIANWVGKAVGSTNGNFQWDRWNFYCGVSEVKPVRRRNLG